MPVTVTKDNVKNVLAAIKRLTDTEILIGIPRDSPHDAGPGQSGEPITSAELGYIHEFGAPEANIPPRPFLISGVQNAIDDKGLIDKLKKTAQTALSGDLAKINAQMDAIGQIAEDAVKQKLADGPFLPLAPRTIAARVARGVTRTDPLIDTGAMRQAVTHVIAKKGARNA